MTQLLWKQSFINKDLFRHGQAVKNTSRWNRKNKRSSHALYVTRIGNMHDEITYVGPHLLIVSLKHPFYRKCIGFADLKVDLMLQNLHTVAWSYEIPGMAIVTFPTY